ncbi:Protein ATP12, mitochondrial [Nakaseomyces bracarensis]|uniref:Protein ATP12, mitochondrial n=1 Tax=Nakaseomyces bracarensis TaxID=273131 RepID=A0ABR4P0S8_9SACH
MLRLAKAGVRPLYLVTRRSFHRAVICYNPLGIDNSTENNLKTETNRLAKTGEKFWEKVGLKETDDKVYLQLDSKTMKTPLGNELAFDSKRKLLALMLKKEWSNLHELGSSKFSLPLTSLVSRCIDLQTTSDPNCDPELVAKIGGSTDVIKNQLLRYIDTDTLLVFSPAAEFEGALRKEQDRLYLPIITKIEEFLSQRAPESSKIKLQILDADIHGLRGNVQSEEVKRAATKYMDSLSLWDLAIFEKTVLTTKSFICGVLLLESLTNVHTEQMLAHSLEDIIRLATLETIFQIERWGEVEDTHDVDKRDIKRNLASAAIVAYRD